MWNKNSTLIIYLTSFSVLLTFTLNCSKDSAFSVIIADFIL